MTRKPMKVDHFAFRVSDLDASIQFYTEMLGLTLTSKTVDEKHGEAFAFLELDGGNLELLQLLNEPNYPLYDIAKPFCPHLALVSDDLDAMVAQLNMQKIPIVKGPLEIPDMVKWLYIADPDKNIIEYVQWLDAK